MLYKVRDFVNANILKSIYYALFESHIYAYIIWGQNISTINHLCIPQNLHIPSVQTTYGKNAFVYMVTKTWNDIQKEKV